MWMARIEVIGLCDRIGFPDPTNDIVPSRLSDLGKEKRFGRCHAYPGITAMRTTLFAGNWSRCEILYRLIQFLVQELHRWINVPILFGSLKHRM
jgi:hypothetical protein